MTFQNLQAKYPKTFHNIKDYPVPAPFCINKKGVKAIVLGCDPSNRSGNGDTVKLCTVFGIGTGDHRYFRDILKNLKIIGLNLENIYVQNVIPYYMKEVTHKNKHWKEIAEDILSDLIKELDSFDKSRKTPVLMTSEIIYKFLLTEKKDYSKPKDLYKDLSLLPIKRDKNKLGRYLFPIYRHYKYGLNDDWLKPYLELLRSKIIL